MSVKNWYVYIARCNDDSLYTGITTDPKKREWQHNNEIGSRYIKSKLPIKIAFREKFNSKYSAAKREKAIKNWKKKYKIKLINKFNKQCLQ